MSNEKQTTKIEDAAQSERRRSRLSKLTFGILGREKQPVVVDEAPLGYTDSGEPKKVTNLHIVDPEGEKPTKVIRVKNW